MDSKYCGECGKYNSKKFINDRCFKCVIKKSLNDLFSKTIFPIIIIGLLACLAFNIFKDQPENIRYFYMWTFIGVPIGMKKMCLFLVPRNFDIAGSVGVLAFNFIIGGVIGGFIVIYKLLGALLNFITCLYNVSLCLCLCLF